MADRYWVGGTNTWDTTAGTKWSTTSGGSGGAAVPTSSDNVFFDTNSGICTVTVNTTKVCNNITASGGVVTLTGGTISASGSVDLSGLVDLTLTTISMIAGSGSNVKIGGSSTGTNLTINTSPTSVIISVNGDLGTVTAPIGSITLTNGSLNQNGHDIFCQNIALGSGTKAFNANGQTYLTGTGTILNFLTNATGFTLSFNDVNVDTFHQTDTSATNKTFSGGGQTYANFRIYGASGAAQCLISGSNTFNELKLDPGSVLKLTNSTTQSFTLPPQWRGTGALPITVTSQTAGVAATIAVVNGRSNCEYLSLKDNHATTSGSAIFYAGYTPGSTNVSGNTGWVFTGLEHPDWFPTFPIKQIPAKRIDAHSDFVFPWGYNPVATAILEAEAHQSNVPYMRPNVKSDIVFPWGYSTPVVSFTWQPLDFWQNTRKNPSRPSSRIDYQYHPDFDTAWVAELNAGSRPMILRQMPRSIFTDAQDINEPFWAAELTDGKRPISTPPMPHSFFVDAGDVNEPFWTPDLIQNSVPQRVLSKNAIHTIIVFVGLEGEVKFWTGSAWVAKPIKVWTGSAWAIKPLKRWTGSAWVITPY